MKVHVLGRGKVGKALAGQMKGLLVRLSPARRNARLTGDDVIVLAVPDPALETMAASIAPRLAPGQVVLHCSGSRPVEVLSACRDAGARIGAMHPLVSFAHPKHTPELQGTTFVIHGDRAAETAARRLAKAAGARTVVAPLHGPAYHAAAALVANGSVALADTGVSVMEQLGVEKKAARRAVAALLHSVADNVERIGVPDALTGPVARGDADTVAAHRRALRKLDRGAAAAYAAIGPAILQTAQRAGLSRAAASAVRKALR